MAEGARRRLRRLYDRLWEVVTVFPTFLDVLFLIVGIQVFFGIVEVPLADVVQPLFVEEQRPLIMRGKLVHLGHGQRVHRAGFHAVPAKDALGDVDVKFTRIALKRPFDVFATDDLDAAGWAGGFAQITAHATFLPVVIAQ